MHHRNRLCITFVFHGAQGSSCLFMVHLHAASVSWLVEAAKALYQVEVTPMDTPARWWHREQIAGHVARRKVYMRLAHRRNMLLSTLGYRY